MNNVQQLANDCWNATKDDTDPEYTSLALSSDFRQNLDDAASAHLQGKGRSGIAGLEAFEDEVVKRIRAQREQPVAENKKAEEKPKRAKAGK